MSAGPGTLNTATLMTSHDFIPGSSSAMAARLIDAGCVSVRTDEPFRLPSGWASPVYMDCRRVISFSELRRDIVRLGVQKLMSAGAVRNLSSVVGGEASGIALAAWIADLLDLPLQFVRKRAAGSNRIEGVIQPDGNALLVDDMMAAGASKAGFANTLRSSGVRVMDVFVVFDYGTFGAEAALSRLGLRLHALANWQDVLRVAQQREDFGPDALIELAEFLRNPSLWSSVHGGKSA